MTNAERARDLLMEIWDAPDHETGVALLAAAFAEVSRDERRATLWEALVLARKMLSSDCEDYFTAIRALAEPAAPDPREAWPYGCTDEDSCGNRHRTCMYINCRHQGRDITAEIDRAALRLGDGG